MQFTRGLGATLTLIAAIAPALITWWRDRDLLRRGDDPALAELLSARRRRTIRIVATALAVMIVLGGAHVAWGIPLLLLLLAASGYPIRVRLLGETWGFGRYAVHSIASFIGAFGFWIALVYLPGAVTQVLVMTDRPGLGLATVIALALMTLLVFWEARYARLWLWTHAATPFESAELTPRFEAIVARAGTPAPRIFRVGPRGSRFVNAIALPSATRPSVALGNALLELLEPDETAAIFAHEVAHFDQFTPRWVRRVQWVTRLLILAGGAAPLIVYATGGRWPWWAGWVWLFIVFAVLIGRAAGRQQRETESDLRAAELCGDSEALVRGLVKLHLHARIPRRYAVDVERGSTHPSLARRIQAIRGASGARTDVPTASLTVATVIRSTRAGSWIAFDEQRAYWLDGVPDGAPADLAALREVATAYRAVGYHDLVELRVAASGTTRTIVARPRTGAPWSVPIHGEDVSRAQEALDVVDVRLAKAATDVPSPAIPRIVALAAALGSLLAGQAGVILVPIGLALYRAGAAAVAALGMMGLVRVAVGVVEGTDWIDETATRLGLLLLVVASAAAVYVAVRHVRAGRGDPHRRLTLGILGGAAVVVSLVMAGQATTRGAADMVGSPIVAACGTLLCGLGAALAIGSQRGARAAAAGVLAAGLGVAAAGIDFPAWTLRHALAESSVQARLESEATLDGTAGVLRVSPSGRRFLASVTPASQREALRGGARLVLGTFGEAPRELRATAGAFVDDDRVLLLDVLDEGAELRLENVNGSAAPTWVDTLPDVDAATARVNVDAGSGRWWVVSDAVGLDGTIIVAGRAGEATVGRRVLLPDTLGLMGDPIVFGLADTVVAVRMSSTLRAGGLPLAAMLAFDPFRVGVVRVVGERVEAVETWTGYPQCGVPADGVAACAIAGNRGTVLRLVRAAGVSTPVARLGTRDAGTSTAGPGPRVTSTTFQQGVTTMDLGARRLVRVALPPNAGYAVQAHAGDGWVIVVSMADGRTSVIRKYRLAY